MPCSRFVAASAVVALAGSAHAFVAAAVAVVPGGAIAPSSGGFNVDATWLGVHNILVTGNAASWASYGSSIQATTWFAMDERGGASGFSLPASPKGGGPDVLVPRWNFDTADSIGAGTPGVDYGILNDGSQIRGNTFGIAFSTAPLPPSARSAVSLVNGRLVDSLFIANLSLTDPNATLVGEDLFIKMRPERPDLAAIVDLHLPLDGSEGEFGFRLEYERDRLYPGHVEVFIVPTTSPAVLATISVVVAGARRRRP